MIDFFFINCGNEYSELYSYIFGGIIGLIGIVAAILLFLVERKLSQSSNILNDMMIKYSDDNLNYEKFKRGMANYTMQWNYVGYDKSFKILLVLFFASSFVLVDISLYNLCLNLFVYQKISYFFGLNIPIVVFLIIVYELIFAPDSMIFSKWRPSNIMKKQFPFSEITEKYCGFFDVEDIELLESNRFKSIKINLIKKYDKALIYAISQIKNLRN